MPSRVRKVKQPPHQLHDSQVFVRVFSALASITLLAALPLTFGFIWLQSHFQHSSCSLSPTLHSNRYHPFLCPVTLVTLMLLRATQLLPFTSRSNVLRIHLWTYHNILSTATFLSQLPTVLACCALGVKIMGKQMGARLVKDWFRDTAIEIFGRSARITSFIESSSWLGSQKLIGGRGWRERLREREARWGKALLEHAVLMVALMLFYLFSSPAHILWLVTALCLVFVNSVSLAREAVFVMFGTFYWYRSTDNRSGQLQHHNLSYPHRSHLPRPKRYPSASIIKSLKSYPTGYGSFESRKYRAALRLGDTGPPSQIPHALPLSPPPYLSSIFISIPTLLFKTLVFTVSLSTSLATLLHFLYVRTGFQLQAGTRATAHFLSESAHKSFVNLRSSEVLKTLAALGFQSGSELRLSVVLPGGGKHKTGSKAGGRRARAGRKFQGSPKTVRMKRALKLAKAKKLARQLTGQPDSDSSDSDPSPSPSRSPSPPPRAETSQAAQAPSSSQSRDPSPLFSPEADPAGGIQASRLPLHSIFQSHSESQDQESDNEDETAGERVLFSLSEAEGSRNLPAGSAQASAYPDFPVVNDPFYPAVEDPEGELEEERKAEEADRHNVGRISRLAYVKEQLALLKQQLPLNNHGAVPHVYRRKTLWIRRPDRSFLLNQRINKALPSLSDLLLPDILLVLPCILLRLASPHQRLTCPTGCGGQPTRSGWSDQPARDVGGLHSFLPATTAIYDNSNSLTALDLTECRPASTRSFKHSDSERRVALSSRQNFHWEKNLPGLRNGVFHIPPPNLTGLPTAILPSSLRRSYLRLANDTERAAAGILAQSATQVVGLDIEWTVEVGEGGRPAANAGWHRTGTIQVATSTEVVIFQCLLSFPPALTLLTTPFVINSQTAGTPSGMYGQRLRYTTTSYWRSELTALCLQYRRNPASFYCESGDVLRPEEWTKYADHLATQAIPLRKRAALLIIPPSSRDTSHVPQHYHRFSTFSRPSLLPDLLPVRSPSSPIPLQQAHIVYALGFDLRNATMPLSNRAGQRGSKVSSTMIEADRLARTQGVEGPTALGSTAIPLPFSLPLLSPTLTPSPTHQRINSVITATHPELAGFHFSHRRGIPGQATSFVDSTRRSFATRVELPKSIGSLPDLLARDVVATDIQVKSKDVNKPSIRGGHDVRQIGLHNENGNHVGYSAALQAEPHKWEGLMDSEGVSLARQHVSSVFENHYGDVYAYYKSTALFLLAHSFHFLFGAFTSFTLNTGGSVICKRHIDGLNLGPGLCGIIPWGKFDSSRSGWIVLEEARLCIEVGPGDVLLFPSAIFTHWNTALVSGDRRNSLAFWTGANLFLWSDLGGQAFRSLSKVKQKVWLSGTKDRWSKAWERFPVLK
ncbi:hypothetical protein P7C70_g6050, partial [Phenoliferia sp. Uapishka_3]